jgi:hypothetical protein
MRSRSVSAELLGAPLEQQLGVRHGLAVALLVQISATHGAMQRLMSYSRHGRPRGR